MSCPLPVKAPWLNAIEPKWVHGKRAIIQPDRKLTAAEVVEYIARGQIKTLAVYDFAPSLSNSQVFKIADWYEKTLKFQRAIAKGDGNLEDAVDNFLKELAQPSPEVPSAAAIDTDVVNQWQYEDVAKNLSR